jgi:putative membrane protein
MLLRVFVASLHLFALGLGVYGVLTRAIALREPPTAGSLRRVVRADIVWGIAAVLWIVTGLWRVFSGLEKGVPYYMHNTFFMAKMTFLALIIVLEISPAVTLTRWRLAIKRGESPESLANPQVASRLATISHVQVLLIVLMIFAAAGMARGMGMGV